MRLRPFLPGTKNPSLALNRYPLKQALSRSRKSWDRLGLRDSLVPVNALTAIPPGAPAKASTAPAAWQDGGRTVRLIRAIASLLGGAILAVLTVAATMRGVPAVAGVWQSGLVGVLLGSLLLPLAGLLATLPICRARGRLGQAPADGPALRPSKRGWRRLATGPDNSDPALHLARLARRPQGIIVPILAGAAGAAALLLRPAPGVPPDALLAGAVLIALTFPLLIAERVMTAVPDARLPEAASLRALLLLPVLVIPAAGLLHAAAGAGLAWAMPAMAVVGIYLGLVAAELALRALANWFLPPPAPADARAAVASLAVLLLQPGRAATAGLAAPLRTHLGLDFSRSWALRYARGAALPVALLLAGVAWGLSGVALIELDQRGIYERLGAPVAVWQPGAHLGLPWPLGSVRLVELGVVHAANLGLLEAAEPPSPAEAAAPASANRLWEGAHPAEVSYIIAATDTSGAQSFQGVSVDMKVLYRTGLDDAAALRAAYAVVAPDALVRAEAGRLLSRFFARQTLDAVLGGGRDALAATLRTALQAELDRLSSGVEVVAIVIEAVHPPAAAADAFHNVQAAEIIATSAISTERGRAQAAAAMARQTATDGSNAARAAAAELVGQAEVSLGTFTADQEAAAVGGQAFLTERYFANLSTALARSPLVILDHRLGGAGAPVIDLRPSGTAARTPDDD